MKAWIISADMGYGHQRAAYALKKIVNDKIISIGTDEISSPFVKKKWSRLQNTYEFVSRNKKMPIWGKYLYKLMNNLQSIKPFYPKKDRSKINLPVKILEKYISEGLYDNLKELISDKNLPILTTFYAPAIALELFGFENIYSIVTDADINRVWVPKNPSESKIKYFVPSEIAYERIKQYGIPEKNIIYTGFPIDIEEINFLNKSTVEERLVKRLVKLDPMGKFRKNHSGSVEKVLNINLENIQADNKIILTFAVGGAGAQKEIAKKIISGLDYELQSGKFKLNLIAGTRIEVKQYFENITKDLNENSFSIIYCETKEKYFSEFNKVIGETDILWTKPSELVFYTALGLPLILAPAIGAQEVANRRWLRDDICSGIVQNKPKYASQWIGDLLNSGRLAEAAWLGYLKTEQNGVNNIINFLFGG